MPSVPSTVDAFARESAYYGAWREHGLPAAGPEPVFDDLAGLAAQACGTPVALIRLEDEHGGWFKAWTGLARTDLPRLEAPGAFACGGEDLFIVGDLRRHKRGRNATGFADASPFRFYAAAALRRPDGHVIGNLCVLDYRPRRLGARQCAALRGLGRQVVSQLECQRTIADLRHAAAAREQTEAALRRSEERFKQFIENGPANAYIKDDEGRFVYVNERLARRFERPAADWLGKTDADVVGSAPAFGVVEHDLRVLNEERPITFEEVVPTPDGQTRHWVSYKFPVHDGARLQLGGLSVDVTERKNAEHERERLVADLQQALAQVKTLRGFLPICASCKNIRVDEGYWQQIESYLSEHAEVEFSHGICPACLEKLYPEFAAYQREQPGGQADGPLATGGGMG